MGGLGDGSTFDEDSSYCLCECYVNKVEGRWCIVSEFVVNGQEAIRRRTANTRPFCKTILEFYEGLEKKLPFRSLRRERRLRNEHGLF